MPEITLLPAKIVNNLRVIADYLVKAPGDNHTGTIFPCCAVNQDHFFRYHEFICSDSLQSVRKSYEFTPSS